MTRVVVIGSTGHVGGYLVPRLIGDGHEVIAVSRGTSARYREHEAWRWVREVAIDRSAAEADGSFGSEIAALEPDVVIDMICFTLDSARQLVESLRGRVEHLLHAGTIWTHGHPVTVPTREDAAKRPFGDYGVQKAAIERYLLGAARRDGVPATVIHPGHIVGTGWVPLNPAGNFNPEVYATIGRGDVLALPNFGLETVHHVHADDVAGVFLAAMARPSASVGESFHAVSPAAVTLRGFAEEMYRWYGHEPSLDFRPYREWAEGQDPEDAAATWEHIARSPSCSMAKAEQLLDFRPRFASVEAVQEAVTWLQDHDRLRR